MALHQCRSTESVHPATIDCRGSGVAASLYRRVWRALVLGGAADIRNRRTGGVGRAALACFAAGDWPGDVPGGCRVGARVGRRTRSYQADPEYAFRRLLARPG